ncbi:hypothetical protein GH714_013449 [Hevea brasiliensis]|uniref:NF-X1-type domain-containing protein n=1 Tax=Hevea brasiliensis TaxID=3981 RepID=A0A6A6N060_HEVBR|nr:hypothetical protein GH714_013449 [Hevea brasiliensis]
MRDCGRHACKRRCCDGDCPPCGEICGRRLPCKNHKCPAPCHRGACAPCPLMVTISCACGETHFEVPCGIEMNQKPPKCRKLCGIPPLCRHGSDSKPHRCHYGACPPCQLLCEEEYPCGHTCKLRCHGPRPPPNPEFTLKPKKKKPNHQSECTPGSSCPPCPELVWRSCVGQHLEQSGWALFSCDNLCGNPLPCGNHYCTKTCHALKSQSQKSLAQCSGEEAHLPTSLSSFMSSWGVPPLQSACETGLSLWFYGPCFRVHILQQLVRKGANDCPLMWWILSQEKEPDTEKNTSKRRKRRERVQETKQISKLQKYVATMKWLLLVVILVVTLVAAAYFGYKGLLWLSDWMNEVEEQRLRRRYPRI